MRGRRAARTATTTRTTATPSRATTARAATAWAATGRPRTRTGARTTGPTRGPTRAPTTRRGHRRRGDMSTTRTVRTALTVLGCGTASTIRNGSTTGSTTGISAVSALSTKNQLTHDD